jgi:hypothetical protein
MMAKILGQIVVEGDVGIDYEDVSEAPRAKVLAKVMLM